nr:Retrovirus-related Pol polyprotein from transposon RE2 [Ipomoea batatas]
MLEDFQMDGAKDVHTPLCSTSTLALEDGLPLVDVGLYRRAIGRLQYMGFTRPDVLYAVNKLSQFMHAPSSLHWVIMVIVDDPLLHTLSILPLMLSHGKVFNPVFHSRMKHLALDYFFVRERVATGLLVLHHVSSTGQVADLLTKPLGHRLFQALRFKIGVSDGSSILQGRIKAPT